ncbi:hypothetical protein PUN28_000909 [Cardiocondyla obscurior]|uniref:Uncharacterized protein n=1 Tax=Cardiocondyla obscurior TaxID=286306 RepID=A0AAW2H1S6_9HYME
MRRLLKAVQTRSFQEQFLCSKKRSKYPGFLPAPETGPLPEAVFPEVRSRPSNDRPLTRPNRVDSIYEPVWKKQK